MVTGLDPGYTVKSCMTDDKFPWCLQPTEIQFSNIYIWSQNPLQLPITHFMSLQGFNKQYLCKKLRRWPVLNHLSDNWWRCYWPDYPECNAPRSWGPFQPNWGLITVAITSKSMGKRYLVDKMRRISDFYTDCNQLRAQWCQKYGYNDWSFWDIWEMCLSTLNSL